MRGLSVALVGGLLISCGGGSGKTATGGSGGGLDGGGGVDGGGADATVGAVAGVSIRFINTFLPSGATGPTLDLYETYTRTDGSIGALATPIVSGLAYGAVSDYVAPHVTMPGSTSLFLSAVPAGTPATDPSSTYVWLGADDGSHEQATVLLENLGPSGGGGPLDGLGSSTFVEKGDDGSGTAGPLAPTPPPGMGEFLASTAPIDVTPTPLVGDYYFFVDDSCTLPLNGDPSQTGLPLLFALSTATPMSFFALFPAASGTHQISVVFWTDRTLPTCAELTARQGTASVDVAAGQQIIAFVYGASATDLHLIAAPIRP
jgi:hypothetical protein